MAEPNQAGPGDGPMPASTLFSAPRVVVETATATGYGLWMVLGTAVALGLYPDGRGEVLVPLFLGLVLVSLGLVATCLRLRVAPAWHGWNPATRMMPTPEGMVAMANYLPMLALAGLARGGNDFWATRLAGAALMLCSLATLAYTARGASRHLPVSVATVANVLPLGRTVSALFAGGLWFWFCVTLQTDAPIASLAPWRMILLGVALAVGLVEGMRWRALRQIAEDRGRSEHLVPRSGNISLLRWRVGVTLLSVAAPCLLIVLHPAPPLLAMAAGVAALSCVIGQCLEQRFYGRACAQLLHD